MGEMIVSREEIKQKKDYDVFKKKTMTCSKKKYDLSKKKYDVFKKKTMTCLKKRLWRVF